MLSASDSLSAPNELVAVTGTAKLPLTDGVPEITLPVRLNPVGRGPVVNVIGVAPVAANVKENGVPWVALAVSVVICGTAEARVITSTAEAAPAEVVAVIVT